MRSYGSQKGVIPGRWGAQESLVGEVKKINEGLSESVVVAQNFQVREGQLVFCAEARIQP